MADTLANNSVETLSKIQVEVGAEGLLDVLAYTPGEFKADIFLRDSG